jgi:hypothetical protein
MSYAPVVLADRRDSSNFRPTPQTPRLKIPFWPGGADRDQFAVELGGRICLVLRMTTCCGRPFFSRCIAYFAVPPRASANTDDRDDRGKNSAHARR